jgi:hypothetical protein
VERHVQVFVGKPDGKSPLGRPWCRWRDNVKIDLQKVGCGGMGWIGLAQERARWRALVNTVMNINNAVISDRLNVYVRLTMAIV